MAARTELPEEAVHATAPQKHHLQSPSGPAVNPSDSERSVVASPRQHLAWEALAVERVLISAKPVWLGLAAPAAKMECNMLKHLRPEDQPKLRAQALFRS